MKKQLKKDLLRRELTFHYERRKLLLKAISNNTQIPLKFRMEALILLDSYPRDASRVRIRNRSIENKKPRAIFQKYGLDRITFRK
jgi:small subunit ribosomal protein S14